MAQITADLFPHHSHHLLTCLFCAAYPVNTYVTEPRALIVKTLNQDGHSSFEASVACSISGLLYLHLHVSGQAI